MAEAFLEEIYKDALVIWHLQESVKALHQSDRRKGTNSYNAAATGLESIIARLRAADSDMADRLENVAAGITEKWSDSTFVAGAITGKLIPLMYEYMSHFTDINVEDGGYCLVSADSGFLTMKDISEEYFIHDPHNPMGEAADAVDSVFKPETGKYLIFGCGLGYIPYMLWERSNGTTKVVIYEEDETVISYAKQFGVLSWIPEDATEIVSEGDKEKELSHFGADYDKRGSYDEVYISPWKVRQYKDVNNGALASLMEIESFNRYARNDIAINIRKNRSEDFERSKILDELACEEWVVVAAGPSFDDNLDFMKESTGKRRIVVVNTALRRLLGDSISPDVVVAADTNDNLIKHIDGLEENTKNLRLIADEATNWKYVSMFKGAKWFVPTPAGKGISIANPDGEEVWDVMGTVTSLAMEVAIRAGAKKVYLVGLDLGYPGGCNYAKGMPHATFSDKKGNMIVKSVDGSMIETSSAFNMFRLGVEKKIADNKDVEFINMSRHGAYIEGAKSIEHIR